MQALFFSFNEKNYVSAFETEPAYCFELSHYSSIYFVAFAIGVYAVVAFVDILFLD